MPDNLNANKQHAMAFYRTAYSSSSLITSDFRSFEICLPNIPVEKIDGSSRPVCDTCHRSLSGSDGLSLYPLTPSDQRAIR